MIITLSILLLFAASFPSSICSLRVYDNSIIIRQRITSLFSASDHADYGPVNTIKNYGSRQALEPFIRSILIGAIAVAPTAAIASPEIAIKDIPILYDGKSSPLSAYLGEKCSLVINVASQCALTPQYEELVAIYDQFHSSGFNILAFPCNQFGSQEPAPVERIRKDMAEAFGVQFPIFDKIDVNGPNASPLYNQLKSYKDIGVSNIAKISWNFEKFLLGPDGTPLRRYKPGIRPAELTADIKSLIATGVIPPKKRATLNEY